jgi:uncharacterized UPF0160 family protein
VDDQAKKLLFKAAKRQAQVEQRALEIFHQLLKIPQFMAWMEQHIVIRDELNEEQKTITTYVIYKEDKTDDERTEEATPAS